jgi:hypothetical protein
VTLSKLGLNGLSANRCQRSSSRNCSRTRLPAIPRNGSRRPAQRSATTEAKLIKTADPEHITMSHILRIPAVRNEVTVVDYKM